MDMPILDEAFVMWGGFVLDFSNRTFAELFREELQVNIGDPRWEVQGERKEKTPAILLATSGPAYGSGYAERAVGIPRD